MTKINQFLDINIGKILIIFLGIQPLIDLITSLMVRFYDVDFTMGIILRSLVLLVFSYYVVFVAKIKWEKLSVAYFCNYYLYIYL